MNAYWIVVLTPFGVIVAGGLAYLALTLLLNLARKMNDVIHATRCHVYRTVRDDLDDEGWPRGVKQFALALAHGPGFHMWHSSGWIIVTVRDYKTKEEKS